MGWGLKLITYEKRCRETDLFNLDKEKAKEESNHSLPLPTGGEDTARLFQKVQRKSQRSCWISILEYFQHSTG